MPVPVLPHDDRRGKILLDSTCDGLTLLSQELENLALKKKKLKKLDKCLVPLLFNSQLNTLSNHVLIPCSAQIILCLKVGI